MSEPQKFRKKPVEIEAMRYDGANFNALWDFTGRSAHIREISEPHAPLALAVYTLEGVMKADVGDWIVKGVQGEFYPVKPDIFKQTYEPAAVPVERGAELTHEKAMERWHQRGGFKFGPPPVERGAANE